MAKTGVLFMTWYSRSWPLAASPNAADPASNTTINNSTESPLRIVPSASDLLPDLFEDFLKTRVAPKRVEIGIMLDPRPVQIVGEWDKALEQIQSRLRFAELRVDARCVVESKKIVGVDSEGSR